MANLIKPGDGSMSNFTLAPEGEALYEFTGKIEKCGDDKQSLKFELEYVDDPQAKVNVFCRPVTESGLRKMVDVIYYSKVGEKLSKKYNLPAIENGWPEEVLKSDKLIERLSNDIAGCRISCDVEHKKNKYKDKDGNDKEGTNANVKKIGFAGNGSKPVNTQVQVQAQAQTQEAKSDEGGW